MTIVNTRALLCQEQPGIADKVIIRINNDPLSLNPLLNIETVLDNNISRYYIFQPMIEFNPVDLVYEPVLITQMPAMSVDKKVYECEIRNEAFWDNQTPITGYDVAFMVKVIKVMSKEYKHLEDLASSIEDVIVDPISPKKFTVKFKKFIFSLFTTPIIPKYKYDPNKYLDKYSTTEILNSKNIDKVFQDSDVQNFIKDFKSDRRCKSAEGISGSGAYKLKSWKSNEALILERKLHWWADQLPSTKSVLFKAYPEKIEFNIINDINKSMVAFKLQYIDVMYDIPGKQFKDLQKLDSNEYNFRLRVIPCMRISMLVLNNNPLNTKKFYLKDPRVRKALAHAINTEEIIENALKGYAIPISCPSPVEKRISYNEKLKPYTQDTAKAIELLEKAGFTQIDENGIRYQVVNGEKIPLEITFVLAKGEADNRKLFFYIAEQAKKVGIQILTNEVSTEEENLLISTWNFDGYFLILSSDAYASMTSPVTWHSKYIGNYNYTGYNNPQVDVLVDKIEKERNRDKQKELYDKLNDILYQDMPAIWLWQEKSLMAYNARFENVKVGSLFSSYYGFYPPMFWTPKNKVKYK
ncbi:MAG: ABC transporter substrate-binding protein [Bacteroidia bacterium]|nr:ABC transporter substrate-binding protein [Bacteroidia bacterium]MDW8346195.1 ABC transporter substrate-binding protein [Bacteroidia bacterium]